jgi:hypothetical protein
VIASIMTASHPQTNGRQSSHLGRTNKWGSPRHTCPSRSRPNEEARLGAEGRLRSRAALAWMTLAHEPVAFADGPGGSRTLLPRDWR